MEEVNRIFKDFLKNQGLKFTPERKAILEEVFATHSHFDAEKLYEKLRRKKKKISRASVYRTLPLLVKAGLIMRTDSISDVGVFEHTYGHEHHDHMLCINCGKIIEFHDAGLEKLKKQICEKYKFKAVYHYLSFKGYCEECLKKAGVKNGKS